MVQQKDQKDISFCVIQTQRQTHADTKTYAANRIIIKKTLQKTAARPAAQTQRLITSITSHKMTRCPVESAWQSYPDRQVPWDKNWTMKININYSHWPDSQPAESTWTPTPATEPMGEQTEPSDHGTQRELKGEIVCTVFILCNVH